MMPYRKYETINEFLREGTMTVASVRSSINLHDVCLWEEFLPIGWPQDNVKRVQVVMRNLPIVIIRQSYEEFDKVMTAFLEEVGIMDPRSLKKKEYNGPLKYYFFHSFDNPRYAGPTSIAASAYPEGYKANNMMEAQHNALFTNSIPMN